MNVCICISHIHIYSVSYFSAVHILIFFKRSLKGKEVLSIESDRFPPIFTSPMRLRNAKKGLKNKKQHLTSHLTRSLYEQDVFFKSYPEFLIGPMCTSRL